MKWTRKVGTFRIQHVPYVILSFHNTTQPLSNVIVQAVLVDPKTYICMFLYEKIHHLL